MADYCKAALTFAFGFATSINDTCGKQVEIPSGFAYITMYLDNYDSPALATLPASGAVTMRLRRDECRGLDAAGLLAYAEVRTTS